MVDLKKKKKTSELQALQNKVMEKFSSKRDFAFFSSETGRVIYQLFNNKNVETNESGYKKKIKSSEREEIR